MLTDAEMDLLVFQTVKSIEALDPEDRYYEFKRAVIEDEVNDSINHAQIVLEERRRLYMNQADFEQDLDRALTRVNSLK